MVFLRLFAVQGLSLLSLGVLGGQLHLAFSFSSLRPCNYHRHLKMTRPQFLHAMTDFHSWHACLYQLCPVLSLQVLYPNHEKIYTYCRTYNFLFMNLWHIFLLSLARFFLFSFVSSSST